MYSYTEVKSETNKNLVKLSSLYQCGHDNTGIASIYHCYGNKSLISTNITKTRCGSHAGYVFQNNPINIYFCCFISNDNHETGSMCMYHYNTPDSFVKKSIFKNNSAKIDNSYAGLLLSHNDNSNVTISECIFLQNKANHAFSASSNGILTVINCTGDDLTASIYFYGTVNTDQMKTNSFSIAFTHISLGECDPEPFSFEPILFRKNTKRCFRVNFIFSFLIFSSESSKYMLQLT